MAEETQDFPNQPQQPLTPGPEQGGSRTKNRPAAGARQVTPDEVFSQDFQGTATAGDFLGLDLEFIGASQGAELNLGVPPQSGESAGELPDHFAAPEVDDLGDDMEVLPVEAGVDGELSDLPADESMDAFGDLDHEATVPAGGRSRAKVFVGIGALAAAAIGAYFFLPFGGPGKVSVADVGDVAKRPPPKVDRTVRPEVPPSVSATTTEQPVEAFVSDTPTGDPTATIDSWSEPGAEETFSLGGSLAEIFGDAPAEEAPVADPLADATSSVATVLGVAEPDPASAEFPDFSAGFEWVSDDMLDMIWRGTEIPIEAIYAPARTLMPRVGMVRLYMKSGEIFEGRVYAVGQNLIWLETEPGRVGLDGGSLDRYEHMAVEASLGAEGTVPLGDLVRVRVPGGFLDGRVLNKDGGVTTVVTEGGGKITIADAAVEPLQTSRAKVLKY